MRVNFDAGESGLILLASDHRTGLWSNSTVVKFGKTVRTSGQLPTASNHTLLSVALTNALRSITRRQADSITPDGASKPRLVVGIQNNGYVKALNAILKNEPEENRPVFKAGKQFKEILFHQLDRFDIELRFPFSEDKTILQLQGWMKAVMVDKKLIEQVPPALAAKAVSQVL